MGIRRLSWQPAHDGCWCVWPRNGCNHCGSTIVECLTLLQQFLDQCMHGQLRCFIARLSGLHRCYDNTLRITDMHHTNTLRHVSHCEMYMYSLLLQFNCKLQAAIGAQQIPMQKHQLQHYQSKSSMPSTNGSSSSSSISSHPEGLTPLSMLARLAAAADTLGSMNAGITGGAWTGTTVFCCS